MYNIVIVHIYIYCSPGLEQRVERQLEQRLEQQRQDSRASGAVSADANRNPRPWPAR